MGFAAEHSPGFDRLIRFEDEEGKICYGELPIDCPSAHAVGVKVQVLEGNPFEGLKDSHSGAKIKKVRGISPSIVLLPVKCSQASVFVTYTLVALMPHRIDAYHSLYRIELSTTCK
jgi:hypothetical protein